MGLNPKPDQARSPRRKRDAAGREPVTEATLRADSRRYVEAKLAYSYALAELWTVPSDRASIAIHTAVVLGKLLEYPEAFKVMKSRDATLFLLENLLTPEDRSVAETLHRNLAKKLDRLTLLGLEFRADRILYSALVLAARQRRCGND
ncbi:MAG TPA: hypothetical protein VGK45_17000 [Thermoanaerobaculia bacterium]